MTPRGEISWVDANLGVDEIREQLLSSPHSLFPVCRGELDEIIGIVRAKELLVALEEGVDVAAIASASPAIIVPKPSIRSTCWACCVVLAGALLS